MRNSESRGSGLVPPRWVWPLVFLAAGMIIFVAIRSSEDGQRGPLPDARRAADKRLPVRAVPITAQDVEVSLSGLGTVTPISSVTVRSRVDGQLVRVAFREGQDVRGGDLLAEIDPRPFEVQVKLAEGQLARDLALLQNAELDLERYRTLLAQDSIAKQQVDTQDALVRQYRGTVKVDEGQLDNARLQLSYTRISAPVAGRIGLRQVDVGNMIRASDANGLAVITQVRPVDVVFSIPQDSLPQVMKRLHGGDKLRVDAFGREQVTRLATGTLLTVDNQIDPSTGTIRLKARLSNEASNLFPNQFVNVRLQVETRRAATVVPSAAIQQGTLGAYVYVVKADRTVTVRAIKPGPVQGDMTVAENGVTAGELVVVDGVDKLKEGASVELVSEDAAARAADSGGKDGQYPRQRSAKP
ncbi:MAG: MdtA/MuxA family multidrug efflux RND transporter periplasmic adaptor subunit [Betaproteobacteria bacterium]|nr:MdtA/MuxA family multidrug efflux RND transporter periplasmic adaptor subunit [Betaproteobacteria bacterium]